MKKLLTTILLTITILLTVGPTALAKENQPTVVSTEIVAKEKIEPFIPPIIPKPSTLPGTETDKQRSDLVNKVLPRAAIFLIGITGSVALLMIVIAGVRLATTYADEEATSKAKNQLVFSILGFLLALLSYTIVTIVSNLSFTGDDTKKEVGFMQTTYAESINIDDLISKPVIPTKDTDKKKPKNTTTNTATDKNQELNAIKALPDLTPEEMIASIIKTILGASMILALIAIVIAGITMIYSRGNEEEIGKAKDILLYLVIGIAIMAAAYGFVSGIAQFNFFQT